MAINKVLPCFENIFGLSRTECECTNEGKPTDADISTSGLFLDELEGGINFDGVDTGDCATLWDLMEAARIQAIENTQDDITIALNTLYKQNRQSFNGTIGKPEFTGTNSTQFPYVGMRLRAEPFRDAQIVIKTGTIALDTSFTGELIVLKAYQSANFSPVIVGTYPFTSVGGMIANINFPAPLVLPMYDENMLAIDYFFMYAKPSNVQPMNTHATCNCGGNERIMKEYILPTGVYSNDLSNLFALSSDRFGNGLMFNASISCKSDLLLCSAINNEPEIAIVAAYAAMYKAGEKLVTKILESNDVSRYTMMNREHLYGKRNHFKKEYNIRIDFIASHIDIENSDCYTCNDRRIIKGKIKI